MTDLTADVEKYRQAAGLDMPPEIESDPLVTGTTPIEQLLRLLGLAANADDPEDYAEGLDEHARREDKTTEAAAKFTAQDHDAAAQVAQVASGIAGTLVGALGGALQPLAQIPQQLGQGAAQALQTGLEMFGGPAVRHTNLNPEPLVDGFDSAADDFEPSTDSFVGPDDITPLGGIGTTGGFSGPGGLGGTAPTSALGPAPAPGSLVCAVTVLAGPQRCARRTTTRCRRHAGTAACAERPARLEKSPKTDTKRVSVPTVRNGAPIQGRLTAGPIEPVDGAGSAVRAFSAVVPPTAPRTSRPPQP